MNTITKEQFYEQEFNRNKVNYLSGILRNLSRDFEEISQERKEKTAVDFDFLYRSISEEEKEKLALDHISCYHPDIQNKDIEAKIVKTKYVSDGIPEGFAYIEKMPIMCKIYGQNNNKLFDYLKKKYKLPFKEEYGVVLKTYKKAPEPSLFTPYQTNIVDLAFDRMINSIKASGSAPLATTIFPLTIKDLNNIGFSQWGVKRVEHASYMYKKFDTIKAYQQLEEFVNIVDPALNVHTGEGLIKLTQKNYLACLMEKDKKGNEAYWAHEFNIYKNKYLSQLSPEALVRVEVAGFQNYHKIVISALTHELSQLDKVLASKYQDKDFEVKKAQIFQQAILGLHTTKSICWSIFNNHFNFSGATEEGFYKKMARINEVNKNYHRDFKSQFNNRFFTPLDYEKLAIEFEILPVSNNAPRPTHKI